MAERGRDEALDGLLCVGVVTGAKGIRGEVRVKSFTAEPADVAAYGPVSDAGGTRSFRLKVTGMAKGQVTVRLSGVDDRNAADALKGLKLYVPRAALPEPDPDEFYHADLVGLSVELAGGEPLGTVKAVHDYGAGTSLEVAGGKRGLVMVPFTKAACPVVDLAAGKVVVEPLPGLLEKPHPEPKGDGNEEEPEPKGDGNEEDPAPEGGEDAAR